MGLLWPLCAEQLFNVVDVGLILHDLIGKALGFCGYQMLWTLFILLTAET